MYPMASAHATEALGCATVPTVSNAPCFVSAGSRVSAGTTTSGATNPLSAMFGAKRRLYRLGSGKASCVGDGREVSDVSGIERKRRSDAVGGWCTHPFGLADDLRGCGAPRHAEQDVTDDAGDEPGREAREIGLGNHGGRRTEARFKVRATSDI